MQSHLVVIVLVVQIGVLGKKGLDWCKVTSSSSLHYRSASRLVGNLYFGVSIEERVYHVGPVELRCDVKSCVTLDILVIDGSLGGEQQLEDVLLVVPDRNMQQRGAVTETRCHARLCPLSDELSHTFHITGGSSLLQGLDHVLVQFNRHVFVRRFLLASVLLLLLLPAFLLLLSLLGQPHILFFLLILQQGRFILFLLKLESELELLCLSCTVFLELLLQCNGRLLVLDLGDLGLGPKEHGHWIGPDGLDIWVDVFILKNSHCGRLPEIRCFFVS
mmetsp:Transcript_18053/g.27999  ORF Transcript_18053/g.27999 Transcript_18053/m.27999 type:complete len:275 (-) Transcript_18053:113-937(-)